jgi:Tol biopolymer transport system component
MRRSWWWLSPVVLLGLGVTTSPAHSMSDTGSAQAERATRPANGRILFTHCEDPGGCQIYTSNPDGTALDQVTNGAGASQGDWSPDGSRIVFAGLNSGDQTIWIVDADGTHPHQLTPNDPDSDDLWPRFTADGRWILFTNCKGSDCDGGIFAVRPNGTGLHKVTRNSHHSYNIADQSPAGSRMAYQRWHVGGVKIAIYVSNARGRHQRRITPPRLQAWWPDWSPTGRRIVFTSQVFGDRPSPRVFTVRPNGSHLKRLTGTSRHHSDTSPAYSPNGRKIVFVSDRRYDDFCCGDLFVVGARGGHVTRIHLPFDAYEPRWGTAAIESAGTRGLGDHPARGLGGSPCEHVASCRLLFPHLSGARG